MARSSSPTPILLPAALLRSHLGSILDKVSTQNARFVITKNGEPTAAVLSITDLDDILEELDPEFQKSLRIAAREHHSGRSVPLDEYRKKRPTVHRPR